MRVFFVTAHFHPDLGGLEKSTGYLARELSQTHEVEVLTVKPPRPPREPEGVRVRRFEASGGPPWQRMAEYLDAIPGPVAVCFFGFSDDWPGEHLDLVGRVASRDDVLSTFKVPSVNEFSLYVNAPERLESFRAVQRVICLNRAIRHELLRARVAAETMVALPNGVPTTHFAPASEDERRRHRIELGLGDGLTCLFHGRFARRKRVDLLLDAFRSTRAAELVLVGYLDRRFDEGARLDYVPDDRVRRFPAQADVRSFLGACDAYVSASEAEGMPNALLEAMAVGLPPIVSDIPGHRELVTHGETGLLFPVGDARALKDRIEALAADRGLLERLARSARQRVVEMFGIERVAAFYRDFLKGGEA